MVSEKSKIYGVDNVGQSDPALTRTDSAIGLKVSVGASEIQSDFNNCYPWSDMQEVMDEHGNVFIRIPKFYSRITKNSSGTYKHQLSGYRYEGFSTLFVDGQGNEIDYVLVGKYEGSGDSSQIFSKSGQEVATSITIGDFRDGCRANGDGYQQYDLLIDAIIKELFLIEFATTDCQSVMYGYAKSNSAAIRTGRTDTVATPSGSEVSNVDGKHACKYRGIENPWGNVFKWCDGITFDGSCNVYICLDPTQYKDEDTSAPYFYVGHTECDGYVSKIEQFAKFPLLGIMTEGNGDETTYYSDYSGIYDGGTVLFVGGSWDSGGDAGLWCFYGSYGASYSCSDIGGRLCYKPL